MYQTSISLVDHLNTIDWVVIGTTISFTIALIFYGHRKKHKNSPSEYLLMGRQLSLPLFVATLVASWYGGIIGVTQIAFEQGVYNLFTQGIFWYLSYLIFALYFVKKIRTYKAQTLPDIVENIFGKKSAYFTAILLFFKTLPITYAISMGILLQFVVPIPLPLATAIAVIIVALYSSLGGLRAVIYSNLAQFFLMCAGLSSVFIFSIYNFGGFTFLHSNLPASHFKICGNHTLSTTLVWFFVACSTTFVNPTFYQRCFAAKSTIIASRGLIISTMIWLMLDICTTFGAMYARAIIPEADSLTAYIVYSVQLLPTGFRGLIIASILATILSTLDSLLFIASTMMPRQKHHVLASGITAMFTIALSCFFNGNIEKVWLIYKSFFSACLLIPIMFGFLIPRLAKDNVFFVSGILSCGAMLIWEVFYQHWEIDSFYVGMCVSILVFAIFYLTRETRITMLIERRRRSI